jgi:hypothetical protein
VAFGGYNWIVLEKADGEFLLLSEKVLERRLYHETSLWNITWAGCHLRAYLNDDFYNSFGEDEKGMIVPKLNKNDDNPTYETVGGDDTQDNIFLLSIEEAQKYFGSSEERAAVNLNGSQMHWYLRSPGELQYYAAYVSVNGDIHDEGRENKFGYDSGVRPAMWVSPGK